MWLIETMEFIYMSAYWCCIDNNCSSSGCGKSCPLFESYLDSSHANFDCSSAVMNLCSSRLCLITSIFRRYFLPHRSHVEYWIRLYAGSFGLWTLTQWLCKWFFVLNTLPHVSQGKLRFWCCFAWIFNSRTLGYILPQNSHGIVATL